MIVVGAMPRLSGLLLALLFTVTTTVDVVCSAVCTPQLTGAASASCHPAASPTADGVLLPAMACHHDVVAGVRQVESARHLWTPAPLGTVQVTVLAYVPASAGADLRRQAVRPRLPHAYPSSVVLRI